MSKENYDRLLENQKATLNNVKAYVSEQGPAQVAQAPVQISKLLDEPLKAQLLLQIRRDAALGVVTSVVQNKHGDGTEDLVRDTRSQGPITPENKDQAARYSRSMDVLNTFRAAQKLLELEGRPIDPALRTLAETQLKAIFDPKTKQRDNKKFNTDLVLALKKLGVKEAESKLSLARDFVGLENPQYHVSTITKQTDKEGKPRIVVESNNMLLGLTDELRRQYTTIAGKDEAAKAKIDWYNKLPEFDKKLVDSYAAKIAKGDTMIPTQLREHLPGIRNAYAKSSFVQEAEEGKFKKVLETLQAGTVSFHGKGDRVVHTQENLDQLDSFLPKGQSLNINPLNSPEMLPGIANLVNKIDRSAPGLIREAQAKRNKGGSISVTPFNVARRMTYNDNSGFDKALYELGTKLLADNKAHAIASFLKDGKNEQAAKDQLASLKRTNPELAQALGHAMTAKHLIVHPHGMRDPQNSNLELSSAMNIVSFQCTQGVLSKIKGLNVELILSHCASGKDRGGILPTKTSHEAISDELGFDGTKAADHKVMEENLGRQISAGHTQVLASINGGTPGCHGIKSESLTSCPKGSKYTSLYEETADNNKFKTKKTAWQKVKKAAKFMAAVPAGILALAASPLISAYVAAKSFSKRGYSPPSQKKPNKHRGG